ncbi:hypothetical protein EVAR_79561_1 [Eumeta japonica]|uniref:Uncharacterized protein n=1 Tax=Eumeta variegata TaxID=151549 RepID=A0A4C1UFM3_EUMVA|nr:hypothetical protein EVAR_79561_1 [Eumeta japonica]
MPARIRSIVFEISQAPTITQNQSCKLERPRCVLMQVSGCESSWEALTSPFSYTCVANAALITLVVRKSTLLHCDSHSTRNTEHWKCQRRASDVDRAPPPAARRALQWRTLSTGCRLQREHAADRARAATIPAAARRAARAPVRTGPAPSLPRMLSCQHLPNGRVCAPALPTLPHLPGPLFRAVEVIALGKHAPLNHKMGIERDANAHTEPHRVNQVLPDLTPLALCLR